jgi:hypothetical protein
MKLFGAAALAIVAIGPLLCTPASAQAPNANQDPTVVGSGMGASGVDGRPPSGASGVVGSGMGASGVSSSKSANQSIRGSGMGASGIGGVGQPVSNVP